MSIGTTKLCHIAILVRDLDKALQNWEQILGVKAGEAFYLPPASEVPAFTNGGLGDYTDCRLAVIQLDNCILEFVQPGKNPSPWRDKLDRDGEGLQHLSFVVPDRKKAQAALQALGAPKPYHIGYYPGGTYSFTDCVKQLGVEINIKTNDDNTPKKEQLLKDPDFHKQDL
ncbi:MAG: VOC family protein [Spirochaetaceae bacterium]|jgi:catechol 2,3-dioxygenase-like lactoylglutathione lyase family enzyme|nr:VOC family protein [Spirochaetaceae bacterium]